MNKFLVFTILVSILFNISKAQQNKGIIYLDNADCESAIYLQDSIFGPFNYHGGFGAEQEFDCADTNSFYSFNKEHNSAWYMFEADKNGFLYMDITSTAKKNDDINFLLFEENNDSVCFKIKNRNLLPIRSNLAINDITTGFATGLDLTKAESYVKKGHASVYSQALEVKRGDQFILVIDHESKTHTGHKIELHYFIKAHDNSQTEEVKDDVHVALSVNTFDKNNGEPLDIDLDIEGITPRKPFITESKHHYTYVLDKYRKYNIHCTYKGFMLYSGEYEPPKDSIKSVLNLRLDPIEKGAKVALYNIVFKPNTTKILQSSEPELTTLVKFLEKNPTVKIKIIGHVNAPGQSNSGKAKNVSKSRAKAVVDYLAANGIKKSRIKFTGVGNAEMIYEKPTSHEQERANRRVEVEILEF